MPAKTLLECPYGHLSEFAMDDERFPDPHRTGRRITCKTCERSFVYSYILVSSWDMRTPVFEGVQEVGDGPDLWRGSEIRFVMVDDAR